MPSAAHRAIANVAGTIGLVTLLACQSATPPSPIGPIGSAPDGSAALATPDDPVETPPPIDYSRTSGALIAAALAGGKIDYQTSLLYWVYAAFGSAELPAEYRSDILDLHAATSPLDHAVGITPPARVGRSFRRRRRTVFRT